MAIFCELILVAAYGFTSKSSELIMMMMMTMMMTLPILPCVEKLER